MKRLEKLKIKTFTKKEQSFIYGGELTYHSIRTFYMGTETMDTATTDDTPSGPIYA